MKKVLLITKISIFCFVVFIGFLTLLVVLPLKSPIKTFIVLSGSMEPTISAGSLVVVQNQSQPLLKGDLITFIRPDNPTETVTHRIIEANRGRSYKTKGDANNIADSWVVDQESVWGKVTLVFPLLGYLINFAKTMFGTFIIVVLPLVLIALSEIRVIGKEIKKIQKTKKRILHLKLQS